MMRNQFRTEKSKNKKISKNYIDQIKKIKSRSKKHIFLNENKKEFISIKKSGEIIWNEKLKRKTVKRKIFYVRRSKSPLEKKKNIYRTKLLENLSFSPSKKFFVNKNNNVLKLKKSLKKKNYKPKTKSFKEINSKSKKSCKKNSKKKKKQIKFDLSSEIYRGQNSRKYKKDQSIPKNYTQNFLNLKKKMKSNFLNKLINEDSIKKKTLTDKKKKFFEKVKKKYKKIENFDEVETYKDFSIFDVKKNKKTKKKLSERKSLKNLIKKKLHKEHSQKKTNFQQDYYLKKISKSKNKVNNKNVISLNIKSIINDNFLEKKNQIVNIKKNDHYLKNSIKYFFNKKNFNKKKKNGKILILNKNDFGTKVYKNNEKYFLKKKFDNSPKKKNKKNFQKRKKNKNIFSNRSNYKNTKKDDIQLKLENLKKKEKIKILNLKINSDIDKLDGEITARFQNVKNSKSSKDLNLLNSKVDKILKKLESFKIEKMKIKKINKKKINYQNSKSCRKIKKINFEKKKKNFEEKNNFDLRSLLEKRAEKNLISVNKLNLENLQGNSSFYLKEIEKEVDIINPNLNEKESLNLERYLSDQEELNLVLNFRKSNLKKKFDYKLKKAKNKIKYKDDIKKIVVLKENFEKEKKKIDEMKIYIKKNWIWILKVLKIKNKNIFKKEKKKIKKEKKISLIDRTKILHKKRIFKIKKKNLNKSFEKFRNLKEDQKKIVLTINGKVIISDPSLLSIKRLSAASIIKSGKTPKSHFSETNLSFFSQSKKTESLMNSLLIEKKKIKLKNNSSLNFEDSQSKIFDHRNSSFLKKKIFLKNDKDFIKSIKTNEDIQCQKAFLKKNLFQEKIKKKKNFDFWSEISDSIIFEEIQKILKKEIQLKKEIKMKSKKRKFNFTSQLYIQKYSQKIFQFLLKNYKSHILKKINKNYGIPKLSQLSFINTNQGLTDDLYTEYNLRPILQKNAIFNYIIKHNKKKLSFYHKLHNKLIWDSINEALCTWKPYAPKGEIFNWQTRFGNCYITSIKKDEISSVFDVTLNKILEWASLKCGVFEEEESLFLENQREDNLVKFLCWEVYESDEKWQVFEKEEIGVVLGLDDIIFDSLLEDLIKDFFI